LVARLGKNRESEIAVMLKVIYEKNAALQCSAFGRLDRYHPGLARARDWRYEWDCEPERRSLPFPAMHSDLATHVSSEALRDRKSEPGAAEARQRRLLDLIKPIENPLNVGLIHTNSCVTDGKADARPRYAVGPVNS